MSYSIQNPNQWVANYDKIDLNAECLIDESGAKTFWKLPGKTLDNGDKIYIAENNPGYEMINE